MKKIELRYTFSDSTLRLILKKSHLLMLFYNKKNYGPSPHTPMSKNLIKYTDFCTKEELDNVKYLTVIYIKSGAENIYDCTWRRMEKEHIRDSIEKVFACHYVEK